MNPKIVLAGAKALLKPETVQKIVAVIVTAAMLLVVGFSSCSVGEYTDLGFSASELFASQLNDLNAVFSSGARVDDKLLYAVYARLFAKNSNLSGKTGLLLNCFTTDDGREPLTDREQIYDKIENTFHIRINDYMRAQINRLAAEMPTGYADRSVLLHNLEPGEKTNIGLVNFAMNTVSAGSGYVYGAYGQDITMEFLRRQQSQYLGNPEANLSTSEIQKIFGAYSGKPAFDCIGLVKAYAWINEETGIIRYMANGFPDFSANSLMQNAVIMDSIEDIPNIPGLVVWKEGHVGVFIGEGKVIEASGNDAGVIESELSAGGWEQWLQVPGITYLTSGTYPYGTKRVTLENGRIKEISAGIVEGKGAFDWPLPSPYGKNAITSTSGSRLNPVTGKYENSHGAVDIAAPAMTPIFAAAEGTVIHSTWHNSYGNYVKIDHGGGWATLYAHQTKRVAKVGQHVQAGDLIGYVGSTGDSTGNHLHFEIRYKDNRLDPMQFFE